MSGIEIIGLISGIITLLDCIGTISTAMKDVYGLPRAFQEVDERLPLVKEILNATQKIDKDDPFWRATGPIVKDCRDKTDRLREIFDTVHKDPKTPVHRRYYEAVRAMGKGNQVEALMTSILEDVDLLAAHRAFNNATEGQIKELADAILRLSNMPSSVPERIFEEGTGHGNVQQIENGGKGVQNNIDGEGHSLHTYLGEVNQHYGEKPW